MNISIICIGKLKESFWQDSSNEYLKRLSRFAKKIQGITLEGISHICFIIGGSNGYDDEVRKAADYRLSFSDFTFPHQLMRVILLEQIYRAFKINANEKYHK